MPTTRHTSTGSGAEFLDSLRDDRHVVLAGQPLHNVPDHPAYQGTAAVLAHMYDQIQDETCNAPLATRTQAGWTHRYFLTPTDNTQLLRQRDAIDAWARTNYGWLTRPPDYKAAFLGALDANADYYGEFADNARAWHQAGLGMPYLNHAFVDPPGTDRGRGGVRITRRDQRGITLSGAKIVATSAALTHYNLLAPAAPVQEPERAIVALVKTSSPGLTLISRTPHSHLEDPHRHINYPIASRFDENDALLILQDVLVPWDNVFVCGDVRRANAFTSASGFHERAMLHTATRVAVKLQSLLALAIRGYDAKGRLDDRTTQARLGEITAWKDLFRSLSDTMCLTAQPWADNAVLPNRRYAALVRPFLQQGYPRVREIIMQDFGSNLIAVGAGAGDRNNSDIAAAMDQLGLPSQDHIALMRTLWDAVGSEFGGRSELFERNFGGGREQALSEAFRTAASLGEIDACDELIHGLVPHTPPRSDARHDAVA